MIITRDTLPYRDFSAAMSFAAAAEFWKFVFERPESGLECERALVDEGISLLQPPTGRIALIDGEPAVGWGCATADELRWSRLRGALALARLPLFMGDRASSRRLERAGSILMTPAPGDLYFCRLGTAERMRRRRLAAKALELICAEARTRSCARAVCEISAGNAPMLRMLAEFGFEQVDRRRVTDASAATALKLLQFALNLRRLHTGSLAVSVIEL